jgi:hypothetical protein
MPSGDPNTAVNGVDLEKKAIRKMLRLFLEQASGASLKLAMDIGLMT